MKNYENEIKKGWKVLEKHPRMSLHASDLKALMEHYNGHNVLDVITDMWLIGLAAGYRAGLSDAKKSNADQ